MFSFWQPRSQGFSLGIVTLRQLFLQGKSPENEVESLVLSRASSKLSVFGTARVVLAK